MRQCGRAGSDGLLGCRVAGWGLSERGLGHCVGGGGAAPASEEGEETGAGPGEEGGICPPARLSLLPPGLLPHFCTENIN